MRDARRCIAEWRDTHNVSEHEMALQLDISDALLGIIENGGYTHPLIAQRIGELVGLKEAEIGQMISPSHEPPKDDSEYHWKSKRLPVGALISDMEELQYMGYTDEKLKRRCKA